MRSKIVHVSELAGHPWTMRQTGKSKHDLKAKMVGEAIIVFNPEGEQVEVSYGATVDNTTVTAYVNNLGFIGGWQCSRKHRPWSDLVDSINAGILYYDMNDLPGSRFRPRKIR